MPSTTGPKLGGPAFKQPSFNWEATEKYTEWKAFILEVRNVLSTYNAQEMDKIAMVKNWLGRKGIHYIKNFIITGWPSMKDELHADLKLYWSYSNELALMDIVKRLEGLSAGNLITTTKVIFTKYGIPDKLMSDAGTAPKGKHLYQYLPNGHENMVRYDNCVSNCRLWYPDPTSMIDMCCTLFSLGNILLGADPYALA